MKNKLFFKIITAVLVVLSLVCLLVACGNKDDGDKQGADFNQVASEFASQEDYDQNPNIEAVDYKGYEFNFICQPYLENNAYSVEYMVAEAGSNNVLQDAIYKRNAALESKYNIKIGQIKSEDVVLDVRAQVMSGSTNFDVIVASCRRLSTLARENLLIDLKSVDRFDMSKSYWDSNAAEQLLIGDKLFFTNCDFNVQELAFVVYFNKALITKYNLTSPYEYMEKNEWTLDNWVGLVKAISTDLDGNSTMNEFDQYGQLTEYHNPRMFLYGFGVRATTNNADGMPVDTLISDKTENAYESLKSVFGNKAYSWNINGMPSTDTHGYPDKWDYARSLFCLDHYLFHYEGTNIIHQFQDMESEFGIMPFPKYDSNQESYLSLYPYFCSMVAMPNTLTGDSLQRAATIFEDMNYLSALMVEPAWYETLLKRRYAKDDESEENLAIIKAGRVYDIGLYYDFGGITSKILDVDITTANLSRNYARQKKQIGADIAKIYRDFGMNTEG